MRLGVVGKGGSGKTSVAGMLARSFARSGNQVVALDCDANPNLGISIGLGLETTERLIGIRQGLDNGSVEHASTAEQVLDRFGATGPDGVRMAVVSTIDAPLTGCQCCGVTPEQLLGQLETGDRVVIADMEAGVGTVGRMASDSFDRILLVSEPTIKSTEVAKRAKAIIGEAKLGPILVVANKVRSDADVEMIRHELDASEVVVIPDDLAVVSADQAGQAPYDSAPDSAAVRAVGKLAERLSGDFAASNGHSSNGHSSNGHS